MQNKGIGVSNLPNLLHSEYAARGCTFNMMVVGSHGLGKTTFLNQFLGANVLKLQPFEVKDSNPYWHTESLCNVQTSYVEIHEGNFLTRMNITEVDAVGDHIDNSNCFEPIVNILEKNFEDYHTKFRQSTRNLIDDKRVHLCLYFLEPISMIKVPDLEVLSRISKLCTIIPVIAKADLLRVDQVTAIKNVFREILETNSIPIFDDRESMAEAPFLVFSHERGESTECAWQSVPMQNYQINDFQTLKRLILERSVISLIREADHFYDNYRITRMLLPSTEDGAGRNAIEKKIQDYQSRIREVQRRIREKRSSAMHGPEGLRLVE